MFGGGSNATGFTIFSWDEWVPENRVLKYNEANVQKQKEVSKQHQSLASKNKKGEFLVIYQYKCTHKTWDKNRSGVNFRQNSFFFLKSTINHL